MKIVKYKVMRHLQGDKPYAPGDTREMNELDAAHLVKSGALCVMDNAEEKKAAKEKAAQEAIEKKAADIEAKKAAAEQKVADKKAKEQAAQEAADQNEVENMKAGAN